MNPKLLLLTLLLALTLAACAPARSEPESGSEASAPSSQAEEQPSEPSSSVQESSSEPAAPEESSAPDWAAEGFAEGVTAYRSGELSGEEWQAFLESQPDFVWLRQYDLWPFGYKEGYYEFDADWAYLKFSTGEELPERLTPEELWSNQERLWEFLEHCRTGEADHLLYGSAKNPAVLDITELRFDGEQLWYRRNPAWSGELPYQTDDGEPLSPLTLHETDTAVELLRENGLVLERFPRYGYERCIPTQEEVLALAEDAELIRSDDGPEIHGIPCARWTLVRSGDGTELFTCYPARDGSACFLPNGMDPDAILLLRPASPA